jgi:lysophospholipase L1-like esterase
MGNRIVSALESGVSGVSFVSRAASGVLIEWVEDGVAMSVVRDADAGTVVLQARFGTSVSVEVLVFNASGLYVGSDGDYLPTVFSQELRMPGGPSGFVPVMGGFNPLTGRVTSSVASVSGHSVTSPAIGALMAQLDTGLAPQVITCLGDSTGNDYGIDWFPLLADKIAAAFPAYTVTHRGWSDTLQAYDKPERVQTGTDGDMYLTTGPGMNTQLICADTEANSITGDLSIAVKIAFDVFPPTTSVDVCGKCNAAGDRSLYLTIDTAGKPKFQWSVDGTNLISRTCSAALVPNADGSLPWLGCTLDVDNGAGGFDVKFWTSSDAVSWTQLGATSTATPETSVFDSTAEWILGGRGGVMWSVAGKMYAMRVYADTAFSVPVLDFSAGMMDAYSKAASDPQGNSWTIPSSSTGAFYGAPEITVLNGSVAGSDISYVLDSTRLAKQVAMQPNLVFVNHGHNSGAGGAYLLPSAFVTAYATLCDAIQTAWPRAGIVAVAQNPKGTPVEQRLIDIHAMRVASTRQYAASKNYALIDAYGALYGHPELMLDDGVGAHPTPAGQQVWRDAAWEIFKTW